MEYLNELDINKRQLSVKVSDSVFVCINHCKRNIATLPKGKMHALICLWLSEKSCQVSSSLYRYYYIVVVC